MAELKVLNSHLIANGNLGPLRHHDTIYLTCLYRWLNSPRYMIKSLCSLTAKQVSKNLFDARKHTLATQKNSSNPQEHVSFAFQPVNAKYQCSTSSASSGSCSLCCHHLVVASARKRLPSQVSCREEYVKYAYAQGHQRPIQDREVDFVRDQVPFPTL